MTTKALSWELFVIMPNLNVPTPTPFDSEWVCICSGRDPRLKNLTPNAANATGRRLLERFTTTFGNVYVPATLLVRHNVPTEVLRQSTLRAFRNLSCASSLGHALSQTITASGSTWLPHHSDHFLFGTDVPMKDGNVGKLSSIVEGFSDEVGRFHGHPSPQIERPDLFNLSVDKVLFRRLVRAWEHHYVKNRKGKDFRRLFRSLEVTFQAGRFPSDGMPSINDVGTRIGLWVSAFEVLFHPGDPARVNEGIVLNEIGKVKWVDRRLRSRRFLVWSGQPRMTFGQSIYHALYQSRNSFMHGNRVTENDQELRTSPRRLALTALAPLLYSAALRVFIDRAWPFRPTDDDEIEDGLFGFSDVEDALIETRRGRPFRLRPKRVSKP